MESQNITPTKLENENIIEKNQEKIKLINEQTQKFKTLKNVQEVRQRGMICAIELQGYESNRRINLEIFQEALKKGVYIRPLGNVVYFMPPYCFTNEQLTKMIDVTYEIVESKL